MTRGLLAVALVLALGAAPAHAWRRPLPGPVARAFAYSPARPFAGGQHRGADFAGPPGAVVRAACAGRGAHAGRGVVTLRCGPWRVTHLPLATLSVHAGTRVREGARLGTLAPSAGHAGLHLGVRRAGDRFAYVDPVPLLGPERPRVGPSGPARRRAPRPPGAAPARVPRTPVAAPGRAARASPVRTRAVATWPVWLGLALALAGAVGGGVRIRSRARRAAATVAAPRTV